MNRWMIALASLLLLAIPGWATAQEKCLTCHEGIEKISDGPVMGKLTCTDCHRGNTATPFCLLEKFENIRFS